MRQPLAFFILIALCSCKQKREQGISIRDSISIGSIDKQDVQKLEDRKTDSTMPDWEKQEDALRTEILNRKENKVLKKGFLQEMYIRNVVHVSKDSLLIKIPFDVHGPDCGAPDCYSTDISFHLLLGDSFAFPKNMQFQEYEHGCIDKKKRLTGNFHLEEQTNRFVIYHSANCKRTLVLFHSNKETGTAAYYFTGVGQNKINGKNVYSIVAAYDEENHDSVYPFTSWILTTYEYENFLHQ